MAREEEAFRKEVHIRFSVLAIVSGFSKFHVVLKRSEKDGPSEKEGIQMTPVDSIYK